VLLILPVFSWGQSIKGVLITEEEEPINFALVSLYQLPNGDLISQSFPSDDGLFSFSGLSAGIYQVFVEGGLGFGLYQSDSILIREENSTPIDLGIITLNYIAQESETATVTADRIKPLLEYDIDIEKDIDNNKYKKEIKQNRSDEMIKNIINDLLVIYPMYSEDFIRSALVLNSNNIEDTKEFLKNPLQKTSNLNKYKFFNYLLIL